MSFASLMVLSLIGIACGLYSSGLVQKIRDVNQLYEEMVLSLQGAELHEKAFMLEDTFNPEFMETGVSAHQTAFDAYMRSSQQYIRELIEKQHMVQSVDMTLLQETKSAIDSIALTFSQMVDSTRHRGFESFGVEGQLMEAINRLESSDIPFDKSYLLFLRRHEKDYFLRKDPQSINGFSLSANVFKDHLTELQLEAEDTIAYDFLLEEVARYERLFNEVVHMEEVIGTSQQTGLNGELLKLHVNLNKKLSSIGEKLQLEIADEEAFSDQLVIITLVALLLLAILLTIVFVRRIARTMLGFKSRIEVMAAGEYPEPFSVTGDDELNETRAAFNNMINRLKTAGEFADEIGHGSLDAVYDERYDNDVLARSLLDMQKKLKSNVEEDKIRNWRAEGLSGLRELLQKYFRKVEQYDRMVSYLARYANGQYATIYCLNEGNNLLELKGRYAVGNRLLEGHTIEIGESLAGQCFQDGELKVLNDLQEGKTDISSGLGDRPPTQLIVIPVHSDNRKIGVIEIGGLVAWTDHEIDFLKRAGEIVAVSLFMQFGSNGQDAPSPKGAGAK